MGLLCCCQKQQHNRKKKQVMERIQKNWTLVHCFWGMLNGAPSMKKHWWLFKKIELYSLATISLQAYGQKN
jgi:hypothetical protein